MTPIITRLINDRAEVGGRWTSDQVTARVAERSLCRLPTDATGWHKSARYVGVIFWHFAVVA